MFKYISELMVKMTHRYRELRKNHDYVYMPTYKLVEINKTDDDEYIVTVQIINKNLIFNVKPEEILSNDSLVDRFSPRDIRALTYLGYLGINSPKYTILAQRLAEDNDKIIFALKKRGEKNIIAKTAQEIMAEKEILESLCSNDAQMIGYLVGSDSILSETKQKNIAYQK